MTTESTIASLAFRTVSLARNRSIPAAHQCSGPVWRCDRIDVRLALGLLGTCTRAQEFGYDHAMRLRCTQARGNSLRVCPEFCSRVRRHAEHTCSTIP